MQYRTVRTGHRSDYRRCWSHLGSRSLLEPKDILTIGSFFNNIWLLYKYTVEPTIATTSRKRLPLLSDQFSKIPKVSKSNHSIWNLL